MNYEKMWNDTKAFIEKQLELWKNDNGLYPKEIVDAWKDEAKHVLIYMNACEAAEEE